MRRQKLTTRQKESQKINRKRAVRQWWRITSRRFMFVCVAFGMLSCAVGGWWLLHGNKLELAYISLSNKFWQKTAGLGFKVDNVYLEGRKFTSLADITRAMNIHSGDPILGIPLTQMRLDLQAVPRVKYAEVARVLPNQLHIHIVEREPVAIWQDHGKLHLIDDDGIVMEYGDPAQYNNLLLIVGDNAPAHTHELFSMLSAEPEMVKNIAAALRIGDRRWNIRFKNGVELKLPEGDATAAWQNFAAMEHENHLLERAIRTVDMRLSDRVFVKYNSPTEATPVKYSGSEI